MLPVMTLLGAVAVTPTRIIIDTDMSTDVDDVAALCMTHALADRGEASILAVVHNTGLLEGVGAISVINHYYGRDDVPVGAYKGGFGATLPGKYVKDIVATFPSPIKNYTQVPAAVEVYRSVLCAQPDGSVTISSIGFMTNLRALLASDVDAVCALDGVSLVRRKVRRLVWMGGRFPTSGAGWEWNFGGGGAGLTHSEVSSEATNFTLQHLPAEVDVIFSGVEVGAKIMSGGKLSACASTANPCRRAFEDYGVGSAGHSSFDPATTLMGVRGVPGSGCATPPYTANGHGGHNVCDPITGSNVWISPSPLSNQSNQSYVELAAPTNASIAAIGTAIDALLCAPAAHPPAPHPSQSRVKLSLVKYPTFCVGLPATYAADGMDAVLVDCNASAWLGQQSESSSTRLWDLQPVAAGGADAAGAQWVMPHASLLPKGSGRYCLTADTRHGDVPPGAPAVLWPCDTTRADQLWSFGACVVNGGTGMHLSVSGEVEPYLGQFIELWNSETPSDCTSAGWQVEFVVH